MAYYCILLFLGALSSAYLPSLECLVFVTYASAIASLLFGGLILCLGRFKRHLIKPLFFLLGAAIFGFSAISVLQSRLPISEIKHVLTVDGCVASISFQQDEFQSSTFSVERGDALVSRGALLNLRSFEQVNHLKLGHCYQLVAQLNPPKTRLNFNGFDTERYLFSNKIIAVGVVKSIESELEPLSTFGLLHRKVADFRYWAAERLYSPHHPGSGLVVNLLTGVRIHITDEQWRVLRGTGTAHLMAISGLHVALFGMLGLMVARLGCVVIAMFVPIENASKIALATGLAFALFYSFMSGFALSTQRAVIMLALVFIAFIFKHRMKPINILFLTMIVLFLIDPLQLLSASYWLSCLAVACLLWFAYFDTPGLLRRFLLPHIVLSLALFPLSVLFFSGASIVSPVVNLLVLPIFSFVLLPMAMLGAIAGEQLLNVTYFLYDVLLSLLDLVSALPFTFLSLPGVSFSQCILCLVLLVIFVLRLSRSYQLLCIVVLVFMLSERDVEIGVGEAVMLVSDVGQGTAIVVLTENYTLLYDTGPPMHGDRFVKDVLQPMLADYGRDTIDQIILSHADIDHRGNLVSVRRFYPDAKLISSGNSGGVSCANRIEKVVDEVTFSVFSAFSDTQRESENNVSCLLRVEAASYSYLIAGDIEKKAEYQLLSNKQLNLRSTVLVAPHHGSKSSSSPRFLAAVSPDLAIFTAGFANRFSFPAQQILDRYHRFNIQTFTTSDASAVKISSISSADSRIVLESVRQKVPPIWRYACDQCRNFQN